jgi:vacuolar transporter chaperone complex subunit 4
VRISLDTELSLIREDAFDGRVRAGDNWRRTDIGIDFPFNQLPDADICRFPYAVLEVKLQTQLGQEPPRWVRELVSSHLVEAVPKFSKFIHGGATLLYDRVGLLPYWFVQMDTDIRKPKSSYSFGIQRIRDSTTVSTTEDTGSMGEMDEEERIGEITPEGPLDENDARNFTFNERLGEIDHRGEHTEEDEFEDSDGEDEDAPARTLKGKLLKAWNWTKQYIVPTPNRVVAQDNPRSTRPQPTFAKRFKAPPGKRTPPTNPLTPGIAVPVRVEPKVYFANERTLLSWYEVGIVIGAIAVSLLNFGDDTAIKAAFGFTLVAVALVMYAMGIFLWRAAMIRKHRAVNYDDRVGPTVLVIMLFCAVGANFGLRYLFIAETPV